MRVPAAIGFLAISAACLSGCARSAQPQRVVLQPVSLGAFGDAETPASPTYFRLGAGDAFGTMIFGPDAMADVRYAQAPTAPGFVTVDD
ncbi:MAG: hypothetical protein KC983_04095 [Phycisphaerales bacterium]|nr:hypothetical protein [Phycisphaerales bacterium]